MGRSFQEKVFQCLLQDTQFCDQMSDVLIPDYFSYEYLREMSRRLFEYRAKYNSQPSIDVIETIVRRDDSLDEITVAQSLEFIPKLAEPIGGDKGYVEEMSLDFCRKQALYSCLKKVIDAVEVNRYDAIHNMVKEALNKGAPRDAGHEYNDNFDSRVKKNVRKPISTGWAVLDKVLNGGYEKGTLATFIAPTGAGKSMFLVNAACAGIAQGLNVLYVTLEMADWKIGLRADSYFSGVEINELPNYPDQVKAALAANVKGTLIVKEWPTKMATVQTIRAHITKLEQTKGFKPDFLVVDYADLLRGSKSYGEKRHELEGVYEELRGLAMEMNLVVITADQTNRGGLDQEVVTIASIGESYAKATVCDLIITISRLPKDKIAGTGRMFVAKSRLGEDGKVLPFLLRPATVKVTVLEPDASIVDAQMRTEGNLAAMMAERKKNMDEAKRKQQGLPAK
jgi:KaiC/GvpD/RAD55 family RecA-like ATPase